MALTLKASPRVCLLLILAAAIAAGQAPPLRPRAGTPAAHGLNRSFVFAPSRLTEYAVIGAPFTCDLAFETTRTALDGTRFNWDAVPKRVFRDSQGRVRMETRVFAGSAAPELKLVSISDLVAGYEYILDAQRMVAHRMPARVGGTKPAAEVYQARVSMPLRPPSESGISTSKEMLGSQTIEGVYTEGWRFATTFPAGVARNDRPFTVTEERWVAPDMAFVLLRKHSDPRFGDQTVRATNLSRTEPDASLFQLPAGYTIVDEDRPFTLVFVHLRQN